MMSFRCLSDLHIIPRDQIVMADFFVEELLKKAVASAMRRKKETGPLIKIKPSRI